MKTFFLFFIVGLITISGALAGGEVTNPTPSTLRMAIDDAIRPLNASMIVWDEETHTTPMQMYETDTEVGIELYAQNQKFHRITITDAIDNKRREVYLCYDNYIINYAYNQVNVSFCQNYRYGTKLRDLKIGQSINFEIPKIINGSNAWSIWVGKGAGGGGGLPVCEGVTANIAINQTQTKNGSNFRYGAMGQWYGSSATGCSIYWIERQQYNDNSLWRVVPTNPTTDTNLNCNGVSCRTNSPSLNTWYYKNVRCDESGNRTIRTRMYYKVLSGNYYANSVTKVQECTNVYVPSVNVAGVGLLLMIIIIVVVTKTRERDDYEKRNN